MKYISLIEFIKNTVETLIEKTKFQVNYFVNS